MCPNRAQVQNEQLGDLLHYDPSTQIHTPLARDMNPQMQCEGQSGTDLLKPSKPGSQE